MNEINFEIKNKELIVYNRLKNKNIKCNIDTIDAIYLSRINNIESEHRLLAICAMTDFDDKMLIYKSTDNRQVKEIYKSLIKTLRKEDSNFINYYPRCINMKKVQSVGWNKIPFKYIATIDFGNKIIQFKTFEDEFNNIIEDLRYVKNKASKVEI